MFNKKKKRCVASLLLCIMLSGFLCPLIANAEFEVPASQVEEVSDRVANLAYKNNKSIDEVMREEGYESNQVKTRANEKLAALKANDSVDDNTNSSVQDQVVNTGDISTSINTNPDSGATEVTTEQNADNSVHRAAGTISYDIDFYIKNYGDHTTLTELDSEDRNLAYKCENGEVILANAIKNVNSRNKDLDWLSTDGAEFIDTYDELLQKIFVAFSDKDMDYTLDNALSDGDALNYPLHYAGIDNGVQTLTDGNLGYYMLASMMVLMNTEHFLNESDIAQVEASLSPAIQFEPSDADYKLLSKILVDKYSMSDADSGDYITDTDDHIYNEDKLGVLYMSSADIPGSTESTGRFDFIGKYTLINCVKKYHEMCLSIMEKDKNGTIISEDNKNLLKAVKLYHDVLSEHIPYLDEMYTRNIDGFDKSVENVIEDNDVNVNPGDLSDLERDVNFVSTLKDNTLFDVFYTINVDIPLVSVDKEAILNDVEVDTVMDDNLSDVIEEQRKYMTQIQDPYLYDGQNTVTPDYMTGMGYDQAYAKSFEDRITDAQLSVDMINDDGQALHAHAVTMSKYIIEGMQYSAAYIPMRTNIYDSNLIETYSEEFLKDFYYKYGFNRKALLIDTSGTSAVDYYTSKGKTQGTRRTATLRDLLECGENDVTLYIDGNFYNADQAISQGNALRTTRNNVLLNLSNDLGTISEALQILPWEGETWLQRVGNWFAAIGVTVDKEGEKININTFFDESRESLLKRYKYDLRTTKQNAAKVNEFRNEIDEGRMLSTGVEIDEVMLKTGGYTTYSDNIITLLSQLENPDYRNVQLNNDPNDELTEDNKDTIVMPSTFINRYMDSEFEYTVKDVNEEETEATLTKYQGYATYTPLAGLAFVSLLYRSIDYYTLNNAVEDVSPVFMASDDLCGLVSDTGSNQWYRNSLINWALLKNVRANVQIDYTYCVDLDCPVYMDIFGNILTESGMVVIPAAANATLHTAAFKNYNVAVALYSVYGKLYSVPLSLQGAFSVLYPYFVDDKDLGVYKITPVSLSINGRSITLDKVNLYNAEELSAIQKLYQKNVMTSNETTRYNWIAMVNIINEVLRGAPISNIDKAKENLYTSYNRTQSATVAAIKYESLLESLHGAMSNTLIAIPNFATMDGVEYYVALLIKLMIVATTAVVIIFIYRDGVSGQFGIRTLWRSLSAIALTFICIVVTPAVFQLTYYAANKVALEDECFHILLLNEEKRQTGMEVGMTSAKSTDKDDEEFLIQLDWLSVPWYKELEHVLYGNTVQHVKDTKLEAYGKSPVYTNSDVTLQNDGVFISTSQLFDSVNIEYTYKPNSNGVTGMFLWSNDKEQSASFYSPYYVFLQSLTANVNEFNAGRPGQISNENFTSKVMSGNRLKTVGLSYNYFNSTAFMEDDLDILRLFQVYMDEDAYVPEGIDAEMDIRYLLDLYGNQIEIDPDTGEAIDPPVVPELTTEEAAFIAIQPEYTIGQIQRQLAQAEEYAFKRTLIFNDEDREGFQHCLWYNTDAVHDFANRVKALDAYARDFVADNHDLMTKVTDETFIKVLALYMSVKYNQLFGIPSANALEIFNLDTEDLLRLCLLNDTEAALSVSMSFPRLVYNYGGEASVYLSAILSVILWVGSFIKPLCTVIVFISVFLSIWVFRVLLRRPSANLFGYLITVTLLCLTNLLHALLLKISVFLPNTGLPLLGCLIFMVVFQVAYLLVLAYVTGVALKDWSNLGYTEYEKEAMRARAKFSKSEAVDNLNGRVKHHDDNWDYYNDLLNQHRKRNA